jgi:GntR family transcriptional regulator
MAVRMLAPAGCSPVLAFQRCPSRKSCMRYPQVAKSIAARIHRGEFVAGDALPSERALAAELGVARSTVRRALEVVERDRMLLSHQGGRWVVRPAGRTRDYDFTTPLMEWASAVGVSLAGVTLAMRPARATTAEAVALEVDRGDAVVRVLRMATIDDRPAVLARTTFPMWLAPALEEVPLCAPSLWGALMDVADMTPGRVSHRVSAVSASSEDSRLLAVPRSAPLVRLLRTAHLSDGRVFEFSDVRLRPGEPSLVVHA